MRTKQQERARFGWLSTAEFGEQVGGVTSETVCEWIAAGQFGKTPDGVPECLNVASDPKGRPDWRIHPAAVTRFYRERAA